MNSTTEHAIGSWPLLTWPTSVEGGFSRTDSSCPKISFVIPVFNGAASITTVVEAILTEFAQDSPEIILVNDGSHDRSEDVGRELADRYPGLVAYVQLARNYGEHRAVLAGLSLARGYYVAILDDDGQHPAVEVRRLLETAQRSGYDVVFGRYVSRQHSWWRRLVSGFHNQLVGWLTQKPSDLYLSSFKIMSRFVVDELRQYQGSCPHLDAIILHTTNRLGQVDVVHRPRLHGESGYTLAKLLRLWLDFVLGYSDRVFRGMMVAGGVAVAVASILLVIALFVVPTTTVFVWLAIWLVSGVMLFHLGMIGEFGGRWSPDTSKKLPYVIRYVYRGGADRA